jgi:hypothetical protein
MTFDPQDFLTFAKAVEQETSPVPEARLRSGVSRAYYATFLGLRERAKQRGLFHPNVVKILHRELILKLKGSSSPDIIRLGHKLAAFKTERERADYELLVEVTIADLQGAISVAEQMRRDSMAYL